MHPPAGALASAAIEAGVSFVGSASTVSRSSRQPIPVDTRRVAVINGKAQ
jgi:hypothetical protein